jgi:hypothetical protein
MGLDCYAEVVGLGGKEYCKAIAGAFEGTPVSLRFPFAGPADRKGNGRHQTRHSAMTSILARPAR